jgi:hypothetical protein
MIGHIVETCPDDVAELRTKLDAMAADGARVISVIWQPRMVGSDQAAAYDARGSFLIVAERRFEDPLRPRGDLGDMAAEEAAPLA